MKKSLIYLGMAAALVACSDEETFVESAAQKAPKGIEFSVAEPETRGQLTSDYHFFWYAEQDRINVYADNVTGTNGVVTAADWSTLPTTSAQYKATRSESTGKFTSVDDTNTLNYNDDKGVNVVALYSLATTELVSANTKTVDAGASTEHKEVTDIKFTVTDPNANKQVRNFNSNDGAPMYSIARGSREASYQSVGETLPLTFNNIYATVKFSSVKNNENYNKYLGKLKKITLEVTSTADDEAKTAQAVNLVATGAVTYNTKDQSVAPTTPAASAYVEVKNSAEWKSEDVMYLSVLPQKRQKAVEIGGKKYNKVDALVATYAYEKVDLQYTGVTTSKDWIGENKVYPYPTLDIAAKYPYIYTKENALLVFSGKFADVYKKDDKTKIVWNGTDVPITDIKKIYSEVELTAEEQQGLKKFTNLVDLDLEKNTSIAENVFDATLASKITNLTLPKVTAINTKDNKAFSALKELNMNSYTFEEDNVAPLVFNSNTKGTLQIVKVEALKSLRPQFGYDRTITFNGYSALKEIYLGTAVALPASCFANTGALTKVSGSVEIKDAPNAFESSNVETVTVASTIIPNAAFKSAKTKNVLVAKDTQVVPTEIGKEAFMSNTAIVLMDLSQAKTIGASAFRGATSFIGTDEKGNNVVTVAAAEIADYTFNNSAIKRIQFVNATKVGDYVLTTNTNLVQVKFLKPVVTAENNWIGAQAASCDLFVNPEQTGVDGLDITLNNSAKPAVPMTKTFKSITKETKTF